MSCTTSTPRSRTASCLRLLERSQPLTTPPDHAWEANESIKSLLGTHYLSSDENMFRSLWKVFRTCRVRPVHFAFEDALTFIINQVCGEG